MDKTKDELLKRPLYVYDLPPEVLAGLTLKTGVEDKEEQTPPPKSLGTDSEKADNLVGSQACSLCGLGFASVLDQRSHQKSDWHHYNLKQRIRGDKTVSEVDFEKLIGDLDESLSGSDSSESESEDDRKETTLTALLKKQANIADKRAAVDDESEHELSRRGRGKPPLIWFESTILPKNTYFGLYRAILTGEEQRDESKMVDVIRSKQLEPIVIPKVGKDGTLPEVAYKGPHFFLCMIGGGHFAAMVVALPPRQTKFGAGPLNREATVLAHKTFHRYTTRRKQGGSQSANDNSKGAAHSAGSTLRRYNEQALVDDVRALLQDWKGLLDTSELLFIRATGSTNRRTLFGPYDGQVLRHNDTRLRGFPFSTRRATQNELMRSFIELTRLKVREIDPSQELKPESTTTTPAKPPTTKPTKTKLSEEEETALLHTSQIQALIRRSKLPALLSYLQNNAVSPDFRFQPPDQNYHAPTPLHLAAHQNAAPVTLGLITRGGADPTQQNAQGKTPFELAGDRATRDAFRVARSELGESKWDWNAAQVPAAMSKAEAGKREERDREERESKEAERRQAEEARLKAEGPVAKTKKSGAAGPGLDNRGPMKSAQEKREEEARGLTPEMRMRLDRERRARAAEERLRRMQGGS